MQLSMPTKLMYLMTAYYTPNDGFTANYISFHKITTRYYCIYLLKSLLPRAKKEHKLRIIFCVKFTTSRDGPVKSTKARLRPKHKKTILLQKNRGKERLEDYSTSVT